MSQQMWIQFCISVACIPSNRGPTAWSHPDLFLPALGLSGHKVGILFLGHLEGLVCGLQSQIGWPPCCNLSLYNSASSPTLAEDSKAAMEISLNSPKSTVVDGVKTIWLEACAAKTDLTELHLEFFLRLASSWKHQVILWRKWQSLVALSEFIWKKNSFVAGLLKISLETATIKQQTEQLSDCWPLKSLPGSFAGISWEWESFLPMLAVQTFKL